MFATVSIINVPIALDLEYLIPDHLISDLAIGDVVYLNLANQRAFGVVIDVYMEQKTALKAETIIQKIEEIPQIDQVRTRIADELSKQLLQPRGRFLRKMLPNKLALEIAREFSALLELEYPLPISSEMSDLLDKFKHKGTLTSDRLSLKDKSVLAKLSKKRLVDPQFTLVKKNTKVAKVKAFIALPTAEYIATKTNFGRSDQVAARRREAFDYILREGPVRDSWIIASTGCRSDDLKWLVDHGLIELTDPRSVNEKVNGDGHRTDRDNIVKRRFGERKIYLYQNDQGSEIIEDHFQLLSEEINAGKCSWLIYPETFEADIAAERFEKRFGYAPAVYHSKISENKRAQIWEDVRENNINVIIGTMDALFLPVNDPGTIIIDEYMACRSFEQSNFSYTATAIADQLHIHFKTRNIYASVLPMVEDVFAADYLIKSTAGAVYELIGSPTKIRPKFEIVDMAAELKNGNVSVVSETARQCISESLANKKLSILFLNRKGYANYVFCRDCGHTLKCNACGSVIRVRSSRKTGEPYQTCDQCGTNIQITKLCPECESANYRPYGAGIEKVEEACRELFPKARIARWESDSSSSYNEISYARIMAGEVDIVIGTQAISKNINFPNVGALGFILGESSFNSPDPYQIENAYRLFLELLGKCNDETQVVLQTYQPGENTWKSLRDGEHQKFISALLDRRFDLGYPPFKNFIKLTNTSNSIEKSQLNCERIQKKVIELMNTNGLKDAEVYFVPPDQTVISKIVQSHLILKNVPAALVAGLDLGVDWRIDVSPRSINF